MESENDPGFFGVRRCSGSYGIVLSPAYFLRPAKIFISGTVVTLRAPPLPNTAVRRALAPIPRPAAPASKWLCRGPRSPFKLRTAASARYLGREHRPRPWTQVSSRGVGIRGFPQATALSAAESRLGKLRALVAHRVCWRAKDNYGEIVLVNEPFGCCRCGWREPEACEGLVVEKPCAPLACLQLSGREIEAGAEKEAEQGWGRQRIRQQQDPAGPARKSQPIHLLWESWR